MFRSRASRAFGPVVRQRGRVGRGRHAVAHAVLAELGPAQLIKLYNSGNFFDPQAIPPEEFPAIAGKLSSFQRVIVESHPKLCGADCFRFRDLLHGELEVAIGLETVQPDVLPRLNKQMTLDDFTGAVERLNHVAEFIHRAEQVLPRTVSSMGRKK